MLRPSVRRLFVGLVVVGLLATATPARASGFWFEGGPQIQDLWSRAWSWLADLLVTEGQSGDAAAPANYSKDAPPGPPPGPPPPGHRGKPNGTNGAGGGGDNGSGSDPDG